MWQIEDSTCTRSHTTWQSSDLSSESRAHGLHYLCMSCSARCPACSCCSTNICSLRRWMNEGMSETNMTSLWAFSLRLGLVTNLLWKEHDALDRLLDPPRNCLIAVCKFSIWLNTVLCVCCSGACEAEAGTCRARPWAPLPASMRVIPLFSYHLIIHMTFYWALRTRCVLLWC